LSVANGGTGTSSLTANNVILGNGTSAVQFVAPSTSGNILTSNGTTWVSSTPAAPSTANVLSATASASVGAVGTYSFLRINQSNSPDATRAPGSTFAGSASHYTFSPLTDNNSYTPSGTWRVMGAMVGQVTIGDTLSSRATVCLRIS